MRKIEHIGIAVKDLETANKIYQSLLRIPPYKTETVEGEGVRTSFFECGQTKIELLEATRADSPIAKFIERRGEGMHHIAFSVDDIQSEMERLRNEGFTVLDEVPHRGADNKMVVFLHPKSANGVLVELCQEINKQK